MTAKTTNLLFQIDLGPDATSAEIDQATRSLRAEVDALEGVEAAALLSAGEAVPGTKAADPVTLGALAIAILPVVLPKLLEFLQAWTLRDANRTIRVKGQVGPHELEFEGTLDEFRRVVDLMDRPPSGDRRRVELPE